MFFRHFKTSNTTRYRKPKEVMHLSDQQPEWKPKKRRTEE